MFEKNGKYYADWRTPDGVRHRKSFPTALGAKRHETTQKGLAPQEAQLTAAVPRSVKPSGSAALPTSSVASRRGSISPTSAKATSISRSRRGRTAAGERSTTTPASSGKSSAPSQRSERQTTSPAFRGSAVPTRAPSGRPKTKRVGVSAAPTLVCAGSSRAPLTLVSGTKPRSR